MDKVKSRQSSQCSKAQKSKFWSDFVCGDLAKNVEARELVKVKMDCERQFVRFTDLDRISSIYCDVKKQNDDRNLNSDEKCRKDNVKKILADLAKNGLLKKINAGKDWETGQAAKEYKEYLKYEVLDGQLWKELSKKYSVQQRGDTRRDIAETSSDTGIETNKRDEQLSNEAPRNLSGSEQSSDTRDVLQSNVLPSNDEMCDISERDVPSYLLPFDLLNIDEANENFLGSERSLNTGDSAQFGLLDINENALPDSSQQAVIVPKLEGPFQLDAPTSNETSNNNQRAMDVPEDNQMIMNIVPSTCPIKGGCSFVITTNQVLLEGNYYINFGDYGIGEAFGSGRDHFLLGLGSIPAATTRGTHQITVMVSSETLENVGECLLMYEDEYGDIAKIVFEVAQNNPGGVDADTSTNSSSNSATYRKRAKKRLRTRLIDMPLLVYLCDEMAERGDEHFFRALNKLGVIGKVLEKRCKDLAKIAREHGHCEFAVTIETSPREPFNDHAIETFTIGSLLDAVRKERLLPNSDSDSDSDSNSCSSGYRGDCDSEDEEEQNYIYINKIVNDVLCKGLRSVFKQEWNIRYQKSFGAWDDTNSSGQQLFHFEKTRSRPNKNVYQTAFQDGDTSHWGCSVLFDAILYSNSIGKAGLIPTIKSEVNNLREIRNEIKHIEAPKLTDHDFQNMTTRFENAFLSLGLPINEISRIKLERNRYKSFQILPPKPMHEVVYRSEKVDQIKQDLKKLNSDNDGKLTYFYISGNPGSGKSQLARQVCEDIFNSVNWQKETTFIMTLDGRDMNALLYSYQDFCLRLNCNESIIENIINSSKPNDVKIKELRSQLSARIKNWKSWWIVVDNVEDLADISPLLPQIGDDVWDNGQIILTTQNRNCIPVDNLFTKHVSLGCGMDEQECRQLLLLLSKTDNSDPLLDEVAEKLDRQPLAIAAAAVYIKQVKEQNIFPEFFWKNCLEKLEKRNLELTEEVNNEETKPVAGSCDNNYGAAATVLDTNENKIASKEQLLFEHSYADGNKNERATDRYKNTTPIVDETERKGSRSKAYQNLEKRCKDVAMIAGENDHCEFAVTNRTSQRKPFNDHSLETLTSGNLLDTVRKERLLPNSDSDSNDDSNSCSNGCKGNCEDMNTVNTSVYDVINEAEPVSSYHVISLCKFKTDKKYKEGIVKEIIAAICAMLNSNGGKVKIHLDNNSSHLNTHPGILDVCSFPEISGVMRILDQSMMAIIGIEETRLKIYFKEDEECITISVKRADFLITANYNLYLPSQIQVVKVPPLKPLKEIRDNVINRKAIPNPVVLGSHCQTFGKDKNCGLCESKICQFKNLKAEQSKRTTLADRITGKGNKLRCYVSAFANHSGGEIYYGITDDGVVKGQFIPNEKDKGEITKKVEKAINKMIWPEHIGQPKQGKNWDIFFEPVVDANSKHVPSTFVIVIYIAPCLGGVFTEEPECSEMVHGKVSKMSFSTWIKRILQPVGLRKSWNSSSATLSSLMRVMNEQETLENDVINEAEPVAAVQVISLHEFQKDERCKEQIVKEIIVDICALLNSNGGKVTIYFKTGNNDTLVEDSSQLKIHPDKQNVNLSPQISTVTQLLDKSMRSIIGIEETRSKIYFEKDTGSLIVSVKRADCLVTTDYNLYSPSQTDVFPVSPLKPQEEIKNNVFNQNVVMQPVQLGTHCRNFFKDKKCGFYESTTCQLKHLEADPSQRTTLADRIIGKGNKFSCYVSAFANHNGGHIYYGISDTNAVEGEKVPNDMSKKEITKKLEKVINKMQWSEHIGQPKRGEHWEIFFEPVMDENSKPVPSTFVIVIYIAPCLGGVFTEEPECYEMVKGKVQKMSFATWKKRILQPVWLQKSWGENSIPHSVQGITWSSDAVRKAFTIDCDDLIKIVSNGNWEIFEKECSGFKSESDLRETMNLLILFKQITACSRTGELNKAHKFLENYKDLSPKVQDSFIFEVLGLILEATLKRASGDLKALKELLTEASSKAERIEPGMVTAIVYNFAATVSDLINLESPNVLTEKALKHLECVPGSSDDVADIRRKAIIILATFHLGCNVSGQLIKDSIQIVSLETAMTCIKFIHESAYEEHPLSVYSDIHLYLVLSVFKYRYSQLVPGQRIRDLRNACMYAKKAKRLAHMYKFTEMLKWSKNIEALCAEELHRDNHLSYSDHVRKDELRRTETPVQNHKNGGRPCWNSSTPNATQNRKFQILSANSQSLDDLEVERNSQVKSKNEKGLLGVNMEPPPDTVQTTEAENSSHKQVQTKNNSLSPSGRQNESTKKNRHSFQLITWSSDAVRKAFTIGCHELKKIISNGNLEIFKKECSSLQSESNLRETIHLLILRKQITACNRTGDLNKAHKFLENYKDLSQKVQDSCIFEVLGLYLEADLKRVSGDLKALKELLRKALSKAEHIEPGLVTATVYIFAATVSDLISLESSAVLTEKALKHLNCVPDSSDALEAMRRKANIIFATFHLGCNVSGQILKDSIHAVSLEKAKTYIKAIFKSAYEEHPLSAYHDIQVNFVLSILKYRHSQLFPHQKIRDLRNACMYAKKAKRLAHKHKFTEMFKWSKNNEALCTQELNNVRNDESDQMSEEKKNEYERTGRGDCVSKSKSTDAQKVKPDSAETLLCADMEPTSNTVQGLKAQDSSDKKEQPQRDSVLPSGRQKQPGTPPRQSELSKYVDAKPFYPRYSSHSGAASHRISPKVSLAPIQPETSAYVWNNAGMPMHVPVASSAFEGSASFCCHTGILPFPSRRFSDSSFNVPREVSRHVQVPVGGFKTPYTHISWRVPTANLATTCFGFSTGVFVQSPALIMRPAGPGAHFPNEIPVQKPTRFYRRVSYASVPGQPQEQKQIFVNQQRQLFAKNGTIKRRKRHKN